MNDRESTRKFALNFIVNETLEDLLRPKRSERREAQIERIIDAARECFTQSGFHGASMQDICAAAGMSPGALYRYFPSKESLIEAISAIHRQEDARIIMSMGENPSVLEGLIKAFMAQIRHAHESGFAPLMAEIFVEGQRNPALQKTCNMSMDQARQMLRANLERGVLQGEISPLIGLDKLLDMMMAMGHGLLTHDLPSKGMSLDDIEAVVRAMVVAVLTPDTHLEARDDASTAESQTRT